MKDIKVQTGLRIPETQYERLKTQAEKTGVSINALILMLIDMGLAVSEKGIMNLEPPE